MEGMDASDLYKVTIVQAAYRGSKSRRELVKMIEDNQRKEQESVDKGISDHITGLLEAAKFAYDHNLTLEEANQNRPESPLVTVDAIRPASSFLFMDYTTPPPGRLPRPSLDPTKPASHSLIPNHRPPKQLFHLITCSSYRPMVGWIESHHASCSMACLVSDSAVQPPPPPPPPPLCLQTIARARTVVIRLHRAPMVRHSTWAGA